MEKKDKTNKNNRCHRAGWSFAEAFYQISQISDNPRDAMRHCAEAIFTGPRSGLDINDIWALLEHNGVLETFPDFVVGTPKLELDAQQRCK